MDYTNALVYYLTYEMPRYGDCPDSDGTKRVRKLAEGPFVQAANAHALLHPGDTINKLLNALHAYYYMLLTCSVLGLSAGSSPSTSSPTAVDSSGPHSPAQEENLNDPQINDRSTSLSGRPSFAQGTRDRKVSLVYKYAKRAPSCLSSSPAASFNDVQDTLKVLRTVQEQIPIRGLLTGVPMLLALQRAIKIPEENSSLLRWVFAIDELLARVWLAIGTVWNVTEVVDMAEQV